MTTINGGSTLTQTLYQRLFERLNTDGDDALTIGEIGAATSGKSDFESIFKALDSDNDGRVMRAEMRPSAAFGADTLGALLDAQSAPRSEEDAAIIADLFARADLDGDGALNADEMKAEGDIRRAANLDAGSISGPIFARNDKNSDGLITPDELLVGGRFMQIKPENVRFYEELGPEEQASVDRMREIAGDPPLVKATAEELAAKRAQMEADLAWRYSGPPGTDRFQPRELDSLRESARASFTPESMSNALMNRLLLQIQNSWAADLPTAVTA